MERLERCAAGWPVGRRFARPDIDAGAAFDVVALGVKPNAAAPVHQINELMPVDSLGFEGFDGLQPAHRAVHIVRAAQAFAENFGDLAVTSSRRQPRLLAR